MQWIKFKHNYGIGLLLRNEEAILLQKEATSNNNNKSLFLGISGVY